MSERRGRTSASQRLDTAAAARRVDRLQRGGGVKKSEYWGALTAWGAIHIFFFREPNYWFFMAKNPVFSIQSTSAEASRRHFFSLESWR